MTIRYRLMNARGAFQIILNSDDEFELREID